MVPSSRAMITSRPTGAAAGAAAPPVGWRLWWAGARPRTLPAALVPVAVGTAVADVNGSVIWWRALLALVVSLALQIGVNYANDYSDGIRGTDDVRVGPLRLVGSKLASPKAVKGAMLGAFATAAVAGLVLASVTSWWLLAVGATAILAAWFYTGGPRPYGYAGLGEVFVFTFFGVVAVAGTAFVQTERLTRLAFLAAVPVGLLATALLVTNNLRDIPGDTVAGKRTLAVRLGDGRTRTLYIGLLALSLALVSLIAMQSHHGLALAALLAVVPAIPAVRSVKGGAAGRALIPVLGATGRVQLVFGALLSVGLVLPR